MSELQLSAQLVQQIQDVITKHDESASDPGVTSQYLAAIIGFLLGQQAIPEQQKTEIIENLGAFMKHVADDVAKQSQQKAPPPPPPQDAFGIWKPKS
ncbi:MAG: hypothetical protein KTR35_22935 [Gammaproteobacteria bacterium]|nr:hypothetical protein [Gammaproteobacteria bacterium]